MSSRKRPRQRIRVDDLTPAKSVERLLDVVQSPPDTDKLEGLDVTREGAYHQLDALLRWKAEIIEATSEAQYQEALSRLESFPVRRGR